MVEKAGRRRSGFTMIELVIVISIVGIIAGLFVRYLGEGIRMYESVDARKELTMEVRQALIRTVREIRQVRSAADVVAADANNFSFYGVNDSLFALSYSGTPGDDLTLQRGTASATIAAGVDSLAFAYTKNDGTPAAPLLSPSNTDIYRVSVFLRLAGQGETVAVASGTFLRNVR